MQIGFKHLFYNKMHTTGSYLMLSFERELTGLGLTRLPLITSDSRRKRSSAQRGSDTNLTGPILFSTQLEVISLDKGC